MTWHIEMWLEAPALGIEGTVEQQRLYAVVVVEVLDVAHMGHAETYVRMQVRGTVRRYLQALRTGDGRCAKPSGVAPAARHVDLQAVHCPRRDHAGEVSLVVAVLSCSDIDAEGVSDDSQAREIVR